MLGQDPNHLSVVGRVACSISSIFL